VGVGATNQSVRRDLKGESMYYTYITAKCSNCKKTLFIKITKIMWLIRINSGLGPNFIICSSCGTRMRTNNKEWQQMSWMEKLWYLILSIFYGVMLGLMSAVVIMVASEKIFNHSISTGSDWLFIMVPVALIIFLIQMIRIELSIQRMEDKKESCNSTFAAL
jgi:hypothetical protein